MCLYTNPTFLKVPNPFGNLAKQIAMKMPLSYRVNVKRQKTFHHFLGEKMQKCKPFEKF
jgi:hypothetical protein